MMQALEELLRVNASFKTSHFHSCHFSSLSDDHKSLFQRTLIPILDFDYILALGPKESIELRIHDYYAYAAYHYGFYDEILKLESLIPSPHRTPIFREILCLIKLATNAAPNSIKYAFVDFWGATNLVHSFIPWSLSHLSPKFSLSLPQEADILIYLSYSYFNRHPIYDNKIKIFWTSEQDLPDTDCCHLSLCPTNNYQSSQHLRYPSWLGCVQLPGCSTSFYGHRHLVVNYKDLLSPDLGRNSLTQRPYISSVLMGNPVPSRMNFVSQLERLLPQGIAKFGTVYNNPVQCKSSILSSSISNICFENALVPGYITEKLFESKIAGCLPIYSGHKSVAHDFNPNCFINLETIDEPNPLSFIANVLTSPDLLSRFLEEPLFYTPPDLLSLSFAFNSSLLKCL